MLYLLHSVSVEWPEFERYPPTTELAQESLENFAREQLTEQTKRELIVRAGDPAVTIVHTVDEIVPILLSWQRMRIRDLCGWFSVALLSGFCE